MPNVSPESPALRPAARGARRAARALLRSAAAALALVLAGGGASPGATALPLEVIDFDALAPGSDVAAVDPGQVGGIRFGSALVMDEAALETLGFAARGTWATSGDTGLFNTLEPSLTLTLPGPAESLALDVLALADAAGDPFPVVLQALAGGSVVAEAVSDPAALGDSGFPEARLSVAHAAGFTSARIFAGVSCGAGCWETGPTSAFFADTLEVRAVPEPGGLLLLAGAAGLALRRGRRRPRSRVRAGLALVALAAAAALALSCSPRPHIVAPADRQAVDPAAPIAVQIDLGAPLDPPGSFRVVLTRGIDETPTFVDLTPGLSVSGAQVTGSIDPADLVPGRHSLFVSVDRDGDGAAENTASASFSFEPALAGADLTGCDPLDPARCLFPFPSDHATVADPSAPTGRRLAIGPTAAPANVFGTHVDPAPWNQADGFSVGAKILTHVPAPYVDLAASGAPSAADPRRCRDADSPVVLLDAETGERLPCWAELDDPVHAPSPDEQALIVRPARSLADARRYIVALRKLRGRDGSRLEPGRAFRLYRDGIPTYLPEFEARRPHMEAIFETLERAGVARDELTLAWDFTTQSAESVAGRLLAMRDDAFARLGAAAPTFRITQVTDFSPAEDARILRRIEGVVDVPLYLTGTGAPGSVLTEGPDGMPVQNASTPTFAAPFTCHIPRSVLQPDGSVLPARPGLYGHGLLGSEGEAGASHVDAMAHEHRFVFCATKWIGMSEDDIPAVLGILSDFSDFPQLSGRLHQAMLNFLFLGRAMIHPEGFNADAAFQVDGLAGPVPVLDGNELFYDGNSQGGIAAGALAAISQDATRFVLGVPGMNYSTLLKRSVDFDLFLSLVSNSYPDPMDRALLIAMAQILWDRVESNGHVNHLTSDPYPDTPPKTLLLHVAFSDLQVANTTAEIMARSIGARIHQPALGEPKHPEVAPYWGIDPLPVNQPYDGSAIVIWDSGNPPWPLSNVPPRPDVDDADFSPCALDHDLDPHECPRRQPEARLQKSLFLQSGGAVVDTCSADPSFPEPCTAYDP